MGCKSSRLSGSWEAVHPPLHNRHYCHCAHDHDSPPTHHHYDTRPESPSVYSGHTHTTPAHSRSNSNDMVETGTYPVSHTTPGEQRPLLGSRPAFISSHGISTNTPKSVYSRFTSSSSFSSTRLFSRSKVDQATPHFVFQKEKPLPSYPGFEAPKQDEVRRKQTRRVSHPRGVSIGTSCGHERQKDSPCFACLREKPKPRRYRSRRNAQVMIPRSSFMGRKRRRGSRSSSSSVEAPLAEEDLPSWVTDRHSVFVPSAPTVEPISNTRPVRGEEERDASSRQKPAKGESSKAAQGKRSATKAKGSKKQNVVDPYAAGGHIVSPEVYYATLPLPDLPNTGEMAERKQRKNPVWI